MSTYLRPWPKRKPRDVSGQRFGKVVVVRMAASDGRGARCLVRCDCGVERYATVCNLIATPPKTHTACERAQRTDAGP